ncbi:MAG: glycerol-3-phosphate 1-O-acyltransferase PlsY [Candidatus Margulisiibacteriota bacterium]
MKYFLLILISYLLGSIPFSHILPRLKGHDISQKGTKNVGATNALIVAGPIIGALALIGDIAKGFLAVAMVHYFLKDAPTWLPIFCGFTAIAGHDFSVFLKFKGGKGLATASGVWLAIDPILAFLFILLWILIILVSRYFIMSTVVLFGLIPIFLLIFGKSWQLILFGFATFFLTAYTHRRDIWRFFEGKEMKASAALKYYLNKE